MSNDPNEPSAQQKRKHLRKDLTTSVNYKILKPSGDVGVTQNISEGGLCLVLSNELTPGTILEVNFELPGDTPKKMESYVEVVWQKKTDKGFLTGVRFK
jgi:c-di-GMP-binding flagellar brake protein YcgR